MSWVLPVQWTTFTKLLCAGIIEYVCTLLVVPLLAPFTFCHVAKFGVPGPRKAALGATTVACLHFQLPWACVMVRTLLLTSRTNHWWENTVLAVWRIFLYFRLNHETSLFKAKNHEYLYTAVLMLHVVFWWPKNGRYLFLQSVGWWWFIGSYHVGTKSKSIMLLQVDGVLGSGTLVSYSLMNLESQSMETDILGNMAPVLWLFTLLLICLTTEKKLRNALIFDLYASN